MWTNYSDPSQRDLHIISLFIVLNVTILSDEPADLADFLVVAGPHVGLMNGTVYYGGEWVYAGAVNSTVNGTSYTGYIFRYTGKNETVTGVGYEVSSSIWWELGGTHSGWNPEWQPRQSRLIALTGFVGLRGNETINMLANESIYMYGRAEGQTNGGGIPAPSGYSFKHVRLQAFGAGFLYNAVLSDNQRWSLDPNGVDVSIVTIS